MRSFAILLASLVGLGCASLPDASAQPENFYTPDNEDDPWTNQEPGPFCGIGYSIFAMSSVTGDWWVDGWQGTIGVELAGDDTSMKRRWWSVVPRAHFAVATGESAGAVYWGRAALNARFSESAGRRVYFAEAGLGMGVLDGPTFVYDGPVLRRERLTMGTPFLQVATGVRGYRGVRGLLVELVSALTIDGDLGADLTVGVAF